MGVIEELCTLQILQRNGVWTWKNYISFLWYAEIIVIGYNLVFFTILWRIFLSEQNAMFYLIMNIFINMIFLID